MPREAPKRSPVSPFVPGTGGKPPLLAGREHEKARLKDLYRPLVHGRGAPHPAVLIGPRGNGKTVLLNWLEGKAKEAGIETTWLTPDQIPTLEALAKRMSGNGGQRWWRRLREFEMGANMPGVGGGSASVKLDDRQPRDLVDLLMQRAGRRPHALLIDEAHMLDRDVGRVLLNAAQQTSMKAPFLLALAGTPDLTDVMHGMGASFWTRARPIGVGLLTDDAAAAAIARPLASEGMRLADQSLCDHVVADSQRYPYFIQAWGDELWKQGESTDATPDTGARTNTVLKADDVDAAGRNVIGLKNDYYASRYEELAKAGLLPAARVIARRFDDGLGPCSWEVLEEIVGPSVESGDASRTLQKLAHAGFVWRPPDENDWGPGIPSLMNYVADQAAR